MILAEPESASLLGGCAFSPHPIQGWTPDFVPGIHFIHTPMLNLKLTIRNHEKWKY